MIKTLIIDDEPLARNIIKNFLKGEKDINVIGEATNGIESVTLIKEKSPNLIFLDIKMPGMNGFEVIEKIGVDNIPYVIFVTAYDKYALKAFELHALDYLLKPIDKERFLHALNRAREQIDENKLKSFGVKVEKILEELNSRSRYLRRVAIKEDRRIRFIGTEDIDWIEAAGKYAKLHTDSHTHIVRESLKTFEKILDPSLFVRIHRSRIVNLKKIVEIQPWFNMKYVIILANGVRFNSGRKYKNVVRNLFTNTAS